MSSSKAEARDKSVNTVVGTGGSGFGGDMDGSPGVRADGGEEDNTYGTETATND